MHKLSEFVELAAAEYFAETGKVELDPVWTAEFFEDGVEQAFPRQELIAFHELVQKALIRNAERSAKKQHAQRQYDVRTIAFPPKRQDTKR